MNNLFKMNIKQNPFLSICNYQEWHNYDKNSVLNLSNKFCLNKNNIKKKLFQNKNKIIVLIQLKILSSKF